MKKPTLQGLNKEVEFIEEKLSDIMEIMTKLRADMSKPMYPQPLGAAPVPLPGMPQVHNPYTAYDYHKAIQAPFLQNIHPQSLHHKPAFMAQPNYGGKKFEGELDGKLNVEVKRHEGNTMVLHFALSKDFSYNTRISSQIVHLYTDSRADISIYLYGLVDEALLPKTLVFDFIGFRMDKMFEQDNSSPRVLFDTLKQLVDKRGENNTIQITENAVNEIRVLRDSSESVDFYSHGNHQNVRVRLENFPSSVPSYGYCM